MSGEGANKSGEQEQPKPAEEQFVDPEVILLAGLGALDKLQTGVGLMQQSQAAFRIRGKTLPDGTIECELTQSNVPVRITPDLDIAIGARQIARQKQRQQEQAGK